MKAYRLKNKEEYDRLNKLSNGDFGKQLSETFANVKKTNRFTISRFNKNRFYPVYFGKKVKIDEFELNRFTMYVNVNEVEEFETYDENDWNFYPNVQPPIGKMLRVETSEVIGVHCRTRYYCGIYDGVTIRDQNTGEDLTERKGSQIEVRFRPW